jgi:adenosine kinase
LSYIEGYFLQEKYEICKMLANEFKIHRKIVILTLSSVFIVSSYYDKVLEIANMADMIVGNIEEAKVLASMSNKDEKSEPQKIIEAIHKILEPKDRIVVITSGSHGAYCSKFNYNRNQLDYILQSFPKNISNEEIVDFNGAGDSFLGGFMAEFIKGKNLYDCSKMGNDAAAMILQSTGCTIDRTKKIKID